MSCASRRTMSPCSRTMAYDVPTAMRVEQQIGRGAAAGEVDGAVRKQRSQLLTFVLLLLVAWLVLAIIGLLIKGLFYLFVIGLILVVVTAVWGIYRAGRRSVRR